MPNTAANKYRAAIEVLQRGRDNLIDSLADQVVYQGDDLVEGGFLLNEMLETQGTRLHFLALLIGQLEQSAEALEEAKPEPPPRRRTRSRSKKLEGQTSKEGSADEG